MSSVAHGHPAPLSQFGVSEHKAHLHLLSSESELDELESVLSVLCTQTPQIHDGKGTGGVQMAICSLPTCLQAGDSACVSKGALWLFREA